MYLNKALAWRPIPYVLAFALLLAVFPLHSRASADTDATEIVAPSGVLVSERADRSDPQPIEQVHLSGQAYVFMDVGRNVRKVSYFLNDPQATGSPFRVSEAHPFDLEGTAGAMARPFDTTTLDDGDYTLTMNMELANRRTQVLHAPVTVRNDEPPATDPDLDPEPVPPSEEEPAPEPVDSGERFLYSAADVEEYQRRMSGAGPFYATGDAGHGGQYSPGDGQRAEANAAAFLANPRESYFSPPNLPWKINDPWPGSPGGPPAITFARPMHAAWVYMTQPDRPDRGQMRDAVKTYLLDHANDPAFDWSDDSKYVVDWPGFAAAPIFDWAHWMHRVIKTRDMIGRDAFTASENEALDRWTYDFANYIFKWLHLEHLGKNKMADRLNRDRTVISLAWQGLTEDGSYDGGPLISLAGKYGYSNRHGATAAAASLAANYLEYFNYAAPTAPGPAYGRYTADELLHHSRLYVEEALHFGVWPQGFHGDFHRAYGIDVSATTGWTYAANAVSALVEIAEFHAKRGDWTVWDYRTTGGHDGSAGSPNIGGFTAKSVHFIQWAMESYVNDAWGRRVNGQRLVNSNVYRDVVPAATANRLTPGDSLLEAGWKRAGQGMPAYPSTPEHQGVWSGWYGEGGKYVGLIEQGGLSPITR